MTMSHKNKTLATFLAAGLGGLGMHRFYLYGKKDVWAWAHPAPLLIFLPISAWTHAALLLVLLPVFAGFIEALAIGLTPDDKWDAVHNSDSGRQSDSGWPLAVLLVLTFGGGATAVIAAIARTFDLLLTGGAYG